MLRISCLNFCLLVLSAVNAQQYTISTVAGNGQPGSSGNGGAAAEATVYYPQGLALAADGSIYFGQPSDHTIRRIDAITGNMEHVAGTGVVAYTGNGGPAAEAGLAYPFGMSFNADGDLFIAERDAFRIRVINAVDGVISTFAGNQSPGSDTEVPALSAGLHAPMGLRVRASGDLLLSVIGNNYVRYIDADTMYLHAFAGIGSPAYSGNEGPALAAGLNQPYDIAEASNGDIYICDINNAAIRKVDAVSGIITTVAGLGTGSAAYNGDGIPAVEATLGLPLCIALDADDHLYISDANHSRIRMVDTGSGLISTIVGTTTSGYNGDNIPAHTAQISAPCGIVVDPLGRIIFADAANHRIRMLTPLDDTAVNESNAFGTITAYPSPATELLHVRSTIPGLLDLVDLQGRSVLGSRVAGGMLTIPINELSSGIYFVKVEGNAPVRVVIQ